MRIKRKVLELLNDTKLKIQKSQQISSRRNENYSRHFTMKLKDFTQTKKDAKSSQKNKRYIGIAFTPTADFLKTTIGAKNSRIIFSVG